ncbi:membrane-anchored junction protein [Leucoraja erinacea]|uniref:membrane-anchored junction protein n=1 Tax=Leucoraja erinaceus TaxID=7782 RepID=UPI002457F067|nr:membrane-anchored junction protein [Leucoraja erinacea]
MALKAFTYPLPETRFIHAGRTVYKLKLRYSHHIREDLGFNRELVRKELQDCIRAVLGNLDNLQPFTTVHFTIFPYKSKWERISELRFKQGDRVLTSYPYVCTLYVELRLDQQHSPVKEGSPFIDSGFVGKMTRETVVAVAERASEKPQLHPTGKRSRSGSHVNSDENASDSETAGKKSKKERKRAAVRVDKARGKLCIAGKMTSPGSDHHRPYHSPGSDHHQHQNSPGSDYHRPHHSPGSDHQRHDTETAPAHQRQREEESSSF